MNKKFLVKVKLVENDPDFHTNELEFEVSSEEKVTYYTDSIKTDGYHHSEKNGGDTLTKYFPPHKIYDVEVVEMSNENKSE